MYSTFFLSRSIFSFPKEVSPVQLVPLSWCGERLQTSSCNVVFAMPRSSTVSSCINHYFAFYTSLTCQKIVPQACYWLKLGLGLLLLASCLIPRVDTLPWFLLSFSLQMMWQIFVLLPCCYAFTILAIIAFLGYPI